MRAIGYVLAFGVMIGAVALIVNTIQLAIFARRREVAVMKLVGATNWFIRIPFMLEGLVHGIAGGIIAFVVTYGVRDTIASFVGNETVLGTRQLYVTPHEAILHRDRPAARRGGGRNGRLGLRRPPLPDRLGSGRPRSGSAHSPARASTGRTASTTSSGWSRGSR